MTTAVKTSYIPFTAAHPRFYDVLGSPDCRDATPPFCTDPAPEGWSRHENGPWVAFHSGTHLPVAGWKIHVSAGPENARRVIERTLESCWDLGICVKTLRSPHTLLVSQSKYADSSASGKVLTAYPPNAVAAAQLLDRLVATLASERGPAVLGEIPVAGAPIYLRFGAFLPSWRVDALGRALPGRREGGDVVADPRGYELLTGPRQELPDELARFVAPRDSTVLDLSEVRVLNRCNGSAVYRARWQGRGVVLKEAKRHSGLDAAGVDATTRLAHERRVLERLSGTGIVPEVLGHFSTGDSDFLVMEEVSGTTLAEWLALNHPGTSGTPSTASASYLARVETMCRNLEAIARRLAEYNVAHGDIHPANILVDEERVVLIDLESASLDGVVVATGLVAPGFSSGGVPDLADDLNAIDRVRITLLSPQTGVLPWRPDLVAVLETTGRDDLIGRTAPQHRRMAQELSEVLLEGITESASLHRVDRLFPGDIAQFTLPGSPLGLLHGAGGVCLTLRALGRPVPDHWVDWIVERARGDHLPSGLAHGAEGTALALALLGREDSALELAVEAAARALPVDLAPGWAFGHAGRGLAFAELTDLLGDARLARAAELHLHAAIDGTARAGHSALESGLLHGWSGVALALTAAGDTRTAKPLRGELLSAALRAVGHEAEHCVVLDGAAHSRVGAKVMPYLGTGSAALGLAARALLDREPHHLSELAGSAAALEDLIEGVGQACAIPSVMGGGLLHGRAGLLAARRRLTRDSDVSVLLHEDRLEWYTVAPGPTSGRYLLGDTNLRLSTDVATGSAGALLALAPSSTDALHRVLRLPRSAV